MAPGVPGTHFVNRSTDEIPTSNISYVSRDTRGRDISRGRDHLTIVTRVVCPGEFDKVADVSSTNEIKNIHSFNGYNH